MTRVLRRQPFQGRIGFTLLELLVVIAIIAVLAAILFPVFTIVRRRAYATTCVSNMNQLGKAMAAYADDNDSHLPLWWFDSLGQNAYPWDQAIFPLVKSEDVFACPANSARLPVVAGKVIRGYAFPRNVSGFSLSNLKRPADTVLLMEKGGQYLFDWNDSTAEFYTQMWSEDDNPDTYPHGHGKNFGYADGHVAWAGMDQGPFVYRFANPDTGRLWPAGYCGNWHDPLGTVTNRSDPGANLPQ